MKILGVIPARYASSRFPGKPLVDILGKTMIQRVYEQASKAQSLDEVLVATDDQRIYKHVTDFGGKVRMTRSDHPTGTDRLIQIEEELPPYDAYINIQGDEPFISPDQIDKVAKVLKEKTGTFAATLVKRFKDLSLLSNPNLIKVTLREDGSALYFSRSPIPFMRNPENLEEWHKTHGYLQHIGIYGYTLKALQKIKTLSQSSLETAESLEQLRWMENGIPIYTEFTSEQSISIDTPEDLVRVLKQEKNRE